MTTTAITAMLLKAVPELVLGVCIKMMCDNGRIHWRDLVNDMFFWVPGVEALDDDGLSRQYAALSGERVVSPPENAVLAK